MIETTLEQVRQNCSPSEWRELQFDREEKLKSLKHSVVLESAFLEMDTAQDWLHKNVGSQETSWDFYFYYKESYDYGYVEYFFLEEEHLQIFRMEVPNFFGVWPDGRRFKTNGWDVILDLGENS